MNIYCKQDTCIWKKYPLLFPLFFVFSLFSALFFVFSLFSAPLSSILYLPPLLCSSVLHSLSPPPFLEFLLVFCFFYAIDGVVRERGFEVLAVPIAISVVIIYLIVNYIHEGLENQPIRLVRIR